MNKILKQKQPQQQTETVSKSREFLPCKETKYCNICFDKGSFAIKRHEQDFTSSYCIQ